MLTGLGLVGAQAFDFPRDDEIFVVAERNAVVGGELLGAGANEIDMWAVAENLAGGANRIAKALDASNASGAEGGAVHDEGVELNFPVAIEKTTAPGIEGFVVFHDDDGFLDGVERRAPALKHAPSRGQSVVHAADVGVDHVVGHGPGAAVDN